MSSTGYLTYISDMLSKHEAVVIPGFGGFITKYKSARLENERGIIHPPTKYIAFNERLDIHDNTFARYLDEQTDVHYSPRLFDHFVAHLKNELSTNQVIVVPDVGRLYQDYEGTTHFMPDLLNLNNDTFGLPEIEAAKGAWVPETKLLALPKKEGNLRTALSSAATVAMLFIAVWAVWLGTSSSDSNLNELSIIDTAMDSASTAPASDMEVKEAQTETKPIEEVNTAAPIIEEVPVQEAVIIVGAFGNPANAEKMATSVEELGYAAYRDQPNRLLRVGVSITYSTQEELDSILSSVQKNITSRAWILE